MLRQTPVKPVDVEELGSIITPPSKEYAAVAEVNTITILSYCASIVDHHPPSKEYAALAEVNAIIFFFIISHLNSRYRGSIITPPSKEYAAVAEVNTLTILSYCTSLVKKTIKIYHHPTQQGLCCRRRGKYTGFVYQITPGASCLKGSLA